MKIDILTLFPEMFDGFINTSIIKRARDLGKVDIKIHNFRDYSLDKHGRVDDYPYGGGAGMVLMCEPIFRAIEDIRTDESLVIMLSPGGKVFKQSLAVDLSHEKHIILLCLIFFSITSLLAQKRFYEWTTHVPGSMVINIEKVGEKVYAATPYEIFYYNTGDNSINKLTKVNGLSDNCSITSIAHIKISKSLSLALCPNNSIPQSLTSLRFPAKYCFTL